MSRANVPLTAVTARPDAGAPFSASEAGGLSTGGGTGKRTQIIAIYGKGGIGKSFTLANPAVPQGPAPRLRSQE